MIVHETEPGYPPFNRISPERPSQCVPSAMLACSSPSRKLSSVLRGCTRIPLSGSVVAEQSCARQMLHASPKPRKRTATPYPHEDAKAHHSKLTKHCSTTWTRERTTWTLELHKLGSVEDRTTSNLHVQQTSLHIPGSSCTGPNKK